jgi:hypothetical protein
MLVQLFEMLALFADLFAKGQKPIQNELASIATRSPDSWVTMNTKHEKKMGRGEKKKGFKSTSETHFSRSFSWM